MWFLFLHSHVTWLSPLLCFLFTHSRGLIFPLFFFSPNISIIMFLLFLFKGQCNGESTEAMRRYSVLSSTLLQPQSSSIATLSGGLTLSLTSISFKGQCNGENTEAARRYGVQNHVLSTLPHLNLKLRPSFPTLSGDLPFLLTSPILFNGQCDGGRALRPRVGIVHCPQPQPFSLCYYALRWLHSPIHLLFYSMVKY